jgi:hypothetical protein
MTGRMDERMDERFLTARPKLRSGLVMGAGLQRGPVRYHLVKYLADGRTFEVGAKEQFVMSRLDGRRTLAEISEEYLDVFGRALVASHWGQILKALAQRGLLDGAPASAPPAEQRSRKPGRHRRSTRSMVKGSRPLVADPTGLVDRVHRRTRYAF